MYKLSIFIADSKIELLIGRSLIPNSSDHLKYYLKYYYLNKELVDYQ